MFFPQNIERNLQTIYKYLNFLQISAMLFHYTLWVGRYEPLFVALIVVTIDNACSTVEKGSGKKYVLFYNDRLRTSTSSMKSLKNQRKSILLFNDQTIKARRC
jgi:hypothetical protein